MRSLTLMKRAMMRNVESTAHAKVRAIFFDLFLEFVTKLGTGQICCITCAKTYFTAEDYELIEPFVEAHFKAEREYNRYCR